MTPLHGTGRRSNYDKFPVTDTGRAALPEIDETFQRAVREHFLGRLTPTQVRQLAAIMRRLGTPVACAE